MRCWASQRTLTAVCKQTSWCEIRLDQLRVLLEQQFDEWVVVVKKDLVHAPPLNVAIRTELAQLFITALQVHQLGHSEDCVSKCSQRC